MQNNKRKGKRGWLALLALWLLAAIILSTVAPGAKEFTVANKDAGLPADSLSIIADYELGDQFPNDGGMPLFAVIYEKEGLSESTIQHFIQSIENIDPLTPYGELAILPLSTVDPNVKNSFLSEDQTTFFFPITFPEGMEGKEMYTLLNELKETVNPQQVDDVELSWTGPAAIAADAVELFSQADVVLLLSTVGLILVLLLLIYRSPLLAFIPLVGAAIVYSVVDRVIGGAAKAAFFQTESQALSIMTILLFAVVTDYSLLIFSRYREELRRHESASDAMRETMKHVREPIFFSGSTIILGVSTLFFAIYEPYRNFAPAFAIAAVAMLIAGLTLIPALFALVGRKAFWPVIPTYGEQVEAKPTIWAKIAKVVTAKPVFFLIPLLILLGVGAWNATKLEDSYDLIESFPEDLSSRVGYERLGAAFSKGSLAPGTLVVVDKEKLEPEAISELLATVREVEGVQSVTMQGNPLSEDGKAMRFSVIFEGNPYSVEAFKVVEQLRAQSEEMVQSAGLKDAKLHWAGETAKQTDLKEINDRDTMLVMIAMTILITIMLGLQTRSVIAPIYMMGTLLLSFAATLGFSFIAFNVFLGHDTIGYRIPMYAFVFLIALGVDYSIMLMARIREELRHHPFERAVQLGLEKTGGVISSAGLILAATFLVLVTMPIYELKLFGIIMAVGILMDTFLVRPLLIPAIILLLGKWSFWPQKLK